MRTFFSKKSTHSFLTLVLLIGAFSFFVHVQPTHALNFQLFPDENASLTDYRLYVVNFYKFAVAASILIATILIMMGGVIWITSAGSPDRITKAKEFIINPIIGVVLLLSTYVILALINPQFVNLEQVVPPELVVPGACLTTTGSKTTCVDTFDQNSCSGDFRRGNTCAEICTPVPNTTDGSCTLREGQTISCDAGKKSFAKSYALGVAKDQCNQFCGAQPNCGVRTFLPDSYFCELSFAALCAMVPHFPHSVQRPVHLGYCAPQWAQVK